MRGWLRVVRYIRAARYPLISMPMQISRKTGRVHAIDRLLLVDRSPTIARALRLCNGGVLSIVALPAS
jgi:hypothetical protein